MSGRLTLIVSCDLVRYPGISHLEHILQLPGHCHHVVIRRIIFVTIREYKSHVDGKLCRRTILSALHFTLDTAKIHRLLDDLFVVVKVQLLRVDRFVEGPGVGRMFLAEHFLNDLVACFHGLTHSVLRFGAVLGQSVWHVLHWLLDLPGRLLHSHDLTHGLCRSLLHRFSKSQANAR